MSRTSWMLRGAAAAWAAAAALPGTAAAQQEPPPPAPAISFSLPRPAERTLPNGLRVVVAEQHDVPLAAAYLVIRSGAESDPAERGGLADFVATLATRGTQSRPGPQVSLALGQAGFGMASAAAWDYSWLRVLGPVAGLPLAAEVLAESAMRPAFADADVRTFNGLAAGRAQARAALPEFLAEYAASRLVFGKGAYAPPTVGTASAVRAITRDEAVRFHQAHWRPDNAVLVLAGDVRPEAGFALAERVFGGWARPSTPLPAPRAATGAMDGVPTAVLVDVPNTEGATLVVARPGVALGSPDYFRALMAGTVLGGGYTSRLSRAARVDRQLATELRTWTDARRGGGVLFASAVTPSAASAPELASLLAGGMGSLAPAAATAPELALRRGFAVAQLARELETVEGLAAHVGMLAARGVPLDRLARYGQEIAAVGAADVQRFAAAHAAPAGVRLVVVGDARSLQDELRRRFPGLVVIPVDDVDLASADLRAVTGGTE